MYKVDKKYCMSSYLMYRTIHDRAKCFSHKYKPNLAEIDFERKPVRTSEELEIHLKTQMTEACKDGKAVLALSGGIDSAILAKYMPKGSMTYTFKCVVPGKQVTDETEAAKQYALACGLQNEVVEIYWEDFEECLPALMKHKGAPVHSIEVQIYKAAVRAKQAGYERIIFGESADANYGGHSNILSRDWKVGEFIDRYAYVMPHYVLKESEMIAAPITAYAKDGYIDVHEFFRSNYFIESIGSYINACEVANIDFVMPYAHTYLGIPLDLNRVRKGENKYIIKEIFNRLYQGFDIPKKTPMPRPMNEWLSTWEGSKREEFWPHCADSLSGDQKWLVYCLEKFLDMLDQEKITY